MASDPSVKRASFVPQPIPAWTDSISSTSPWSLGNLATSTFRVIGNLFQRTSSGPTAVQDAPLFGVPLEAMEVLVDSLSLKSIRGLRTCRALNALLDRDKMWQRFYERDYPQCQKGEKQTFKDAYKNTHVLRSNLSRGICSTRTLSGHHYKVTAIAAVQGKLITGSVDSAIRVWDMNSGECLQVLKGHSSNVKSFAILGDKFYSCSSDETVKLWDLKTGTGRTSTTARWLHAMAVAGEKLFIPRYNGHGDKIHCVDTDQLTSEGHSAPLTIMIGAGKKLISGSEDCTIKIWDAETLGCLHELRGHQAPIRSLVVRGATLISGSEDKTIKLWDMATGACVHPFENAHKAAIDFLGVTRGMLVSGSSLEHEFNVWDLEKKVHVHSHYHGEYESCAFLAEGKLYAANKSGRVIVWDFKASDVEVLQEIAAIFRLPVVPLLNYLDALRQVRQMPEEKRQKIYGMLETLKPSLKSRGEIAFQDRMDKEATMCEKASAIEFFLAEYLGREYRKI